MDGVPTSEFIKYFLNIIYVLNCCLAACSIIITFFSGILYGQLLPSSALVYLTDSLVSLAVLFKHSDTDIVSLLKDAHVLMAVPELYRYGREGYWFNQTYFVLYMLDGLLQVSSSYISFHSILTRIDYSLLLYFF
jgi:hypothetical protein